jgi:hypothetical protein
MVIFAAVGGRMSLLGAVYGTLLVNFGKTYFSETFPDLWLFLMGGLFIAVVMYFPNGLAGLWQSQGKRLVTKLRGDSKPVAPSLQKSPSRSPDHPPLNPSVMASSQARPWRPANERTRHRFRIGCPSGPGHRRPDRVLRRLQGHRQAQPVRAAQRGARGHRPQRRRQDHAAGPDLRQDPRHRRQHQVQQPGADQDGEHAIVRVGSGASSRPRRSTRTCPCSRTWRCPSRVAARCSAR